jgi:hypothetical protein
MQVLRVTHPFHPLHGREYQLFAVRRAWNEERAYFKDERGEVRALPIAWTSVRPEDPFIVAAKGRCPVRLQDLLEIAELIARRKP